MNNDIIIDFLAGPLDGQSIALQGMQGSDEAPLWFRFKDLTPTNHWVGANPEDPIGEPVEPVAFAYKRVGDSAAYMYMGSAEKAGLV